MQSKEIYPIVRRANDTGTQVGPSDSGWEDDPRAALNAYEALAKNCPKGQSYTLERVITSVVARTIRA